MIHIKILNMLSISHIEGHVRAPNFASIHISCAEISIKINVVNANIISPCFRFVNINILKKDGLRLHSLI